VAQGKSFDRDHSRANPKKKSSRSRSTPRKIKGLVNARLLAFEFPETFVTPSDAVIKKLKPGDFVKVARNNERFWVRIDGFVGRRWHGTIDNYLINQSDIEYGDKIYFMRKNIYDVDMV
jgi:hypothetical protein